MHVQLGLSKKDMRNLMAEVDEDDSGCITYAEFVPIAVEIIQAMRLKENVQVTNQEADMAAMEEANLLVNGMTMDQLHGVLGEVFDQVRSM